MSRAIPRGISPQDRAATKLEKPRRVVYFRDQREASQESGHTAFTLLHTDAAPSLRSQGILRDHTVRVRSEPDSQISSFSLD
jgi:hypothetical protein